MSDADPRRGDVMGLRSRYQAFAQLSRFSAVVSALVVALPLCVLFALAWRAMDRFETATAQVMKQGSQHVVERVANRIQRDFKSPAFNLLERVDHNAVRELDLAHIAATLEQDKPTEPLLDQFFVWSKAAPAHPDGAMYFFRRSASSRTRRWRTRCSSTARRSRRSTRTLR
jgi:hypothetical protein